MRSFSDELRVLSGAATGRTEVQEEARAFVEGSLDRLRAAAARGDYTHFLGFNVTVTMAVKQAVAEMLKEHGLRVTWAASKDGLEIGWG